ncbi:TlpA family protein disulfide reductase [bacterium]|nr:TlpA family protein disulfide reductase [bacterium]
MRVLLLALGMCILALPAWAYTPHVGDRAADFSGWDVVSKQTKHLEDLLGKWVFVDFWAYWCGPCMGELPNLLAVTEELRKRDDFALFTASLDSERTLDGLKQTIRENGIDYPVLYDGGGWQSVPAVEWDIHSIPATFLIDPQGNIAATNLRGETLGPGLDFFLDYSGVYTPIGVRSAKTVNGDGSVVVRLELSSPQRKPLKVEVDYYHVRNVWAEDDPEHEGRPAREYVRADEENPEIEFEMGFTGSFGEATYEFTIPAVDGAVSLTYNVSVMLPGTEHLLDGEGIWVRERGSVRFEE